VKDINVAQTYPFDTATFASAVSDHASTGRLGFNAGGDVTYRVRSRAGVGFGVSYSQARVPLSTGTGDTVTAGGLRVDAGLRVRF